MRLFGFEIKRAEDERDLTTTQPLNEPLSAEPRHSTVIPPENEDGSFEVTSLYSAHVYTYNVANINFSEEIELIKSYRELSANPEVDQAIDEIINEAIVLEDNYQIVDIDLDELENVSETFKTQIREEFQEINRMLGFNINAYNIFRQWYIDGRLYYNIVIDFNKPRDGILKLNLISPFHIRKVREIIKDLNENGVEVIKDIREYYVYDDSGKFGGQVLKIPLDSVAFIHSGLVDEEKKIILSYLHKALKPINQLRMMEDAMLIYRLARAPERRVFYVDVGDLPKTKAEQYMKSLMAKFKNKLSYDAINGKVRDNRNQLSMMEDFWIPRRSEGRTTEIQTLPGAGNTDNSAEVQYFLNKVYGSLNVPVSRLNSEQPSGFNLGRQAEITRDELKFTKFIRRLQAQFSNLFYSLLRVQLLLKNVISPDDWNDIKDKIRFVYEKDNFYTDSKNAAILKDKIEILTSLDQFVGKYFSKTFVFDEVLNMSEDEIEAIIKQMKEDLANENAANKDDQPSEEGMEESTYDTSSFGGSSESLPTEEPTGESPEPSEPSEEDSILSDLRPPKV